MFWIAHYCVHGTYGTAVHPVHSDQPLRMIPFGEIFIRDRADEMAGEWEPDRPTFEK